MSARPPLTAARAEHAVLAEMVTNTPLPRPTVRLALHGVRMPPEMRVLGQHALDQLRRHRLDLPLRERTVTQPNLVVLLERRPRIPTRWLAGHHTTAFRYARTVTSPPSCTRDDRVRESRICRGLGGKVARPGFRHTSRPPPAHPSSSPHAPSLCARG